MPVAPSFQTYKKLTDKPFEKNGKLYVTVEHPNTKNHRDVRWYTDAEYAKAYGKKLAETGDEGFEGLKHARGFDNGPILVIRHNRPEDEEWLSQSIARYAMGVGWYIASTDTFPSDAPKHFKYLLLGWEEFRDKDDKHMKSASEISNILLKKAKKGDWFNINA